MTAAEAMSRSSAETWHSPVSSLHTQQSAHDGILGCLIKLLFELFQFRLVIHFDMEPRSHTFKLVL